MKVPKTFLEWKFYGMDLILNPFPEPCRVVKDFMLSACRGDVSEFQVKTVRFRTAREIHSFKRTTKYQKSRCGLKLKNIVSFAIHYTCSRFSRKPLCTSVLQRGFKKKASIPRTCFNQKPPSPSPTFLILRKPNRSESLWLRTEKLFCQTILK